MMLAMLSVIPHILEGLLLAEVLAPLGRIAGELRQIPLAAEALLHVQVLQVAVEEIQHVVDQLRAGVADCTT